MHAVEWGECARPAGQSIRLRGKNLTETEHVKLGAYHTLELEPQRAFKLEKASWDSLDIERIKQACDPAASADLAAVLITVRGPGGRSCSFTWEKWDHAHDSFSGRLPWLSGMFRRPAL